LCPPDLRSSLPVLASGQETDLSVDLTAPEKKWTSC